MSKADIAYVIEYARAVATTDERKGIALWLSEIYQAIDELRLEDIQLLIRGAKSFELSLWGKSQIFLGQGDFQAQVQNWESAIVSYQRGLNCLQRVAHVEDDRAIFLNNLGLVFQEQARYDDAISAYLQVIELYGSIKDTAGRSRALSNLASVYDTRGEWDKAIHHYKLSLQGMDEMADWSTFASLWNNLGVAYQTSGQRELAKEAFEHCVNILDDAGQAQSEKGARILMNLGELYAELGQTDRATRSFQNAIEICRETENLLMEISVWNNFGAFHTKTGNHADAISCYEACLKLAIQTGNRTSETLALSNLGSALEDVQSHEKAREKYMQSLLLADEQQDLYGIARAHNNLGVLHEKQRSMEQALFHYEQAVLILRKIGDAYREVTIIINLASIHARMQNMENARNWLEHGVAISRQYRFVDHLALLSILKGDIDFTFPERISEACDAYVQACLIACDPNANSLPRIMEIVLKRMNVLSGAARQMLCDQILKSHPSGTVNWPEEFTQSLTALCSP